MTLKALEYITEELNITENNNQINEIKIILDKNIVIIIIIMIVILMELNIKNSSDKKFIWDRSTEKNERKMIKQHN